MLTFLITNLLLAAVLGAGLLALVYCAVRRPVEFAALVLVVWIASVAVRDAVDLSVVVSEFRVTAMDTLALVMLGTAAVRFALNGVRGAAGGLALALLLLLAIHLGRGISDFGLEAAVNSSRSTLYFVAALAYAATVPEGWDRRVWKLSIAAGILVAALAVPFWLTGGLGSADTSIVRNGELIGTRPVVAAGALLILQAAILALALRWPSPRAATWIAASAGTAVVLLQHRTVWVAALAVAVVAFFVWTSRAGRSADRTAFAVLGISLLLLPLVALGLTRTGPLVSSAQEVTSGNSTFAWRTTGWRELISSHDSPGELAVGSPSGTRFDRRIDGNVVDASAHNGFVESFLRFGLPGVAILVLVGFGVWFGRGRVGDAVGLPASAVAMLLLTQLLFSVAYSLGPVQGLLLGILVGGLAGAPAPGRSLVTDTPPFPGGATASQPA